MLLRSKMDYQRSSEVRPKVERDEYVEAKRQEIAYWRKAAERQRAQGQTATAITFENMAWLLEHQDSWLGGQGEKGKGQA
jgi:hypothetical protein